MTELRNVPFEIGKLEDGKWAAATNHSPYFLFVGDTEEEVIALSDEALSLYFGVVGSSTAIAKAPASKAAQPKSISTFYSKKIVSRDEMVAA